MKMEKTSLSMINVVSLLYPWREIRKHSYINDFVTGDVVNCAVDFCYVMKDIPNNCFGG